MKKYLVGGAVRDILLKQPVTDRDWVVVGAKPHDLLQEGYVQVGKDFPVFLHPKTKEEYALARTERKSGLGYTGFICDFNENITLQQDLERRDLTINAIAMDENQQLVDPFHGVRDINQRILRHVSAAFTEDPLRVLRVARFAARFHHLGFTIATETLNLMQKMVLDGEIQTLTPERVWKETEKALNTKDPQIFFSILREIGALAILYPEIDKLFSIPNIHQQNLGQFTLSALKYVSEMTNENEIRFATLCCHVETINNAVKSEHPHLIQLEQLCQRCKIPNKYQKIANLACRYCELVHNIGNLSATEIVTLLNNIDVWRNPHHLQQLLIVCCADAKVINHNDRQLYQPKIILEKAYQIAKSVSIKEIIAEGFVGKDIQIELNRRRIKALSN